MLFSGNTRCLFRLQGEDARLVNTWPKPVVERLFIERMFVFLGTKACFFDQKANIKENDSFR